MGYAFVNVLGLFAWFALGLGDCSSARASARVKLDRENQTITVVTHITYYGPAANLQSAEMASDEIARYWSGRTQSWLDEPTPYFVQIDGKPFRFKIWAPYSVKKFYESDAEIDARARADQDPSHLYVRLEQGSEQDRSYVDTLYANRGTWYISDRLGQSTTAPHEFGHMLGLDHQITYWMKQGQPGIMCARGTLVESQYQWNPDVPAGEPGGTLNPYTRRVLQMEVNQLGLDKLKFDDSGWADLVKPKPLDFEGLDFEHAQSLINLIWMRQIQGK